MKFCLLLCLICYGLFLPGSSSGDEPPQAGPGIEQFMEAAPTAGVLKKQIAMLIRSLRAKLGNPDPITGTNLTANYTYDIKKSRFENYYNRIDRWELISSLRFGDLVEDLQLPVYLNLDHGSEVVFARRFEKRESAVFALPMLSLKHMPFKAETALNQLKPGDFVGFPARLNLVMGAQGALPWGFSEFKANSYFLISGQFNVQVFRLSNDRARVRMLLLKKSGNATEIRNTLGLNVYVLTLMDKDIKSLLRLDYSQFLQTTENGDILLVDYIFDLRNLEAIAAYDSILSSTQQFKEVQILASFQAGKDTWEIILTNTTAAEKIWNEDRNKPISEQRVHRVFSGMNHFKNTHKKFRLGLGVLGLDRESILSRNWAFLSTPENTLKKYYFASHYNRKVDSLLFNLQRQTDLSEVAFLFESDDSQKHLNLRDFIFTHEAAITFTDLNTKKNMFDDLKRNLTDDIYKQLDLSAWKPNDTPARLRIFLEIVLGQDCFGSLWNMSEETIRSRLNAFIEATPPDPVSRPGSGFPEISWQDYYAREIKRVAHNLAHVFSLNSWDSEKERLGAFLELRRNPVFKQLGAGFLLSLSDKHKLFSNATIKVKISAKKKPDIMLELGKKRLDPLIAEIVYINAVINDQTYEIREEDISLYEP